MNSNFIAYNKSTMSAPPNSPNSMAFTRVPSDTNSMSSAQSECDVIVNVMTKKKTKTIIEEAKAKRRARYEKMEADNHFRREASYL